MTKETISPVNINESNLIKLTNLVNGIPDNCLEGSKIVALYNLIQKQGTPITVDPPTDKWHGVKAILLPNNLYLAMIHRPAGKSFFPCSIVNCLLEPNETSVTPHQ